MMRNALLRALGRLMLVPAAALAVWTAPADAEIVYGVRTFGGFTRVGFSGYAGAGGAVRIVGEIPDGSSAEELVAALRLPGFFPQTPLRVDDRDRGRRIVLVIGGRVNSITACRGASAVSAGGSSNEITAVFCNGSKRGSVGSVIFDGPAGPSNPDFSDGMARLFLQMFPLRDPRFGRDS